MQIQSIYCHSNDVLEKGRTSCFKLKKRKKTTLKFKMSSWLFSADELGDQSMNCFSPTVFQHGQLLKTVCLWWGFYLGKEHRHDTRVTAPLFARMKVSVGGELHYQRVNEALDRNLRAFQFTLSEIVLSMPLLNETGCCESETAAEGAQ